MTDQLTEAIAELEEEKIMDLVRGRLEEGADPKEILENARKGIERVGERYENDEYFLPELMLAGEVLDDVMEVLEPEMEKGEEAEEKDLGKVVLGTVEGDIHDIGKGIVSFVLEINGFDVHDVGVDVPPEKFVEEIEKVDPEIVGLSVFLTTAIEDTKDTIEAIEGEGLRDDVKIMVGGAPVNQDMTEHVGADDFGEDAMEAVSLAKNWVGVN